MSGETDLTTLLRTMQPQLEAESYVFCSLPIAQWSTLNLPWVGCFAETAGMTVILRQTDADRAHLAYATVFCQITLTVHSSLTAIGFLAAIATALAAEQISVNAISAYYHDHLFVPATQAPRAIAVLQALGHSS